MGCTTVRERYSPIPLDTDATYELTGNSVGGFLCVADGTITVMANKEDGSQITIVDTLPVSAGIYYPIPFYLGKNNGVVILSGGAKGTVGV